MPRRARPRRGQHRGVACVASTSTCDQTRVRPMQTAVPVSACTQSDSEHAKRVVQRREQRHTVGGGGRAGVSKAVSAALPWPRRRRRRLVLYHRHAHTPPRTHACSMRRARRKCLSSACRLRGRVLRAEDPSHTRRRRRRRPAAPLTLDVRARTCGGIMTAMSGRACRCGSGRTHRCGRAAVRALFKNGAATRLRPSVVFGALAPRTLLP